ncbi:MAG: CdaR family protein [Acidobacteriota bacterium]|nr:CdaR family protein [Acidobacteriota bacterium]
MIRLRQWILNNFGLKLISLGLSFLLWNLLGVKDEVIRVVTVPVQFVNLAPDLEISTDYEHEVEVTIRSGRTIAIEEVAGRMSAEIDLQSMVAGKVQISLTEHNISNRPLGVDVLSIAPNPLQLELEQIHHKMVEVRPRLEGEPEEGYALVEVRSSPPEVRVSGLEAVLAKVSAVPTETVDISGRSSGFDADVDLDSQDPRVTIDGSSPVVLQILIEEKRRELTLSRVAVELESPRDGTSLMTRSLNLVVSVPISFEGEISSKDFRARVAADNLEPKRQPHEILPEIVAVSEREDLEDVYRVESTRPEQVRIRVRR